MKEIMYELWQVLLRIMWLIIVVTALVLALRVMAWADAGSRGDGTTIKANL